MIPPDHTEPPGPPTLAEAVGQHIHYNADPTWGHIAQCDNGDLWLPAYRNLADGYTGPPWYNRRLDLRKPLHWLPYLRSRLTSRVAMVDSAETLEAP